MKIHKTDTTSRKEVNQFVNVPFELYRGCSQWVPMLRSEAKKVLDRENHPFYQHSTADFFVAEEAGKTLGRIAVMHNRNHNTYTGKKTAFFGFFDSFNDQQVANALFQAAQEWSGERGLEEMVGPKGLLNTETGGVLVEGFEHRAAFGVSYNYQYYDALIKKVGFEKDTDLLGGYVSGDGKLPERLHRIAERVKKRGSFWVKTFDNKREMHAWVPKVAEVHHRAFRNNSEYFPPSEAELAVIAENLIAVSDPGLIKFIMHNEDIAGFIFAYHDISPALQKSNGRLLPLGLFYIWQERNRNEWVNVNGLGLLPEFQGLGANALLYSELEKTLKAYRFKHLETIHIGETNLQSRGDNEAIGVEWRKRHRTYRCKL